jgi:hypothetical protein
VLRSEESRQDQRSTSEGAEQVGRKERRKNGRKYLWREETRVVKDPRWRREVEGGGNWRLR